MFSFIRFIYKLFNYDIAENEGTVVTSLTGLVSTPSDITASVFKGMQVQSGGLNTEFLFARFVAQIRAHLHVVLCIDPTEDAFKDHIRKYPHASIKTRREERLPFIIILTV